jgi:hypothetical protein
MLSVTPPKFTVIRTLVKVSFRFYIASNDSYAIGVFFSALQGPVPEINNPTTGRTIWSLVEILADQVGLDYVLVALIMSNQLLCLGRIENEA